MEVTLDVHFKVRHGSNLVLGNVTWEVPNEKIDNSILGRHLFESLGCDNRYMLVAASNQQDWDIDVSEKIFTDDYEKEGNIAALFGDYLYHTGIDDADGLENIDDQT